MKLFVCHSSSDKPVVRQVSRRIRPFLVDTWVDERELAPGDSLHTSIGDALEDADCLLACVSRNSLESRWVKKELSVLFAREDHGDRPLVIPLILDGTQPTGFLRDRLQVRLRNGESRAIAEILRGLYRSRDVILLGLSPEEPFAVSAESLDAAVESRQANDASASPLFVVDVDGFLNSLSWYHRQAITRLEEGGHATEAERWRHYLDWNDGVRDNLSVGAEGIFFECASRRPNTMDLRPALDVAWKRYLQLLLLDMPAFMPGYSEVDLPTNLRSWQSWFAWADEQMGSGGRGGLQLRMVVLRAEKALALQKVDLVGPGSPPDPVGKVWLTRDRVGRAHGPCFGMFRIPITELFSVWLDEALPQLAAQLVFDATYAGRIIDREEFRLLRMESYEWLGPS